MCWLAVLFQSECPLSLDRGGKPGGVSDKTLAGAVSVGWTPDHLGGSRRARRRYLAGSQRDGAPCRRHQPAQLPAPIPPGALVVCSVSTPYAVIHQGPHVRSSSESSPSTIQPIQSSLREPPEGWVGTWQGDIRDLAPGVHVVSNYGDVDDDTLPVVREVRERIASLDVASPVIDDLLGSLGRVCAVTDQPFPLCYAGGDYGTVSSSLVAVKADGTVAAYWHAPGPPSEVAYSPVDLSPDASQPRALS